MSTEQDRHFLEADPSHFRWTTEDPGFAPIEDALLGPWLTGVPFPCLEVGAGEGTNLARLAREGRPVGVDRSVAMARFAARAVPAARVAAANATALPFRTGTFASVLIRDVLQHGSQPRVVAAEAVRVLGPRGLLLVLEPHGRNPLVALQARIVPAERGLRHFTPASVLAALDGLALESASVAMAQGFPLRRLLLHHRFGWPALGRLRAAAAVLAGLERFGERVLPESRWSYSVVRAWRL